MKRVRYILQIPLGLTVERNAAIDKHQFGSSRLHRASGVSAQLDGFLVFGGFVDGQDDFDGLAGFASVDPEILAALEHVEKGLEVPRLVFVRDGGGIGGAAATANGIREIASAINEKGGINAVNLRIAEQYLNEFGKLAKTNNSIIIPSDLSDIAGMIKAASSVIKSKTDAAGQTEIG